MAAKTANSNVCDTMTDSIKLPTANVGFLNTASSNKCNQAINDNKKQQHDHRTGKTYVSVTITNQIEIEIVMACGF